MPTPFFSSPPPSPERLLNNSAFECLDFQFRLALPPLRTTLLVQLSPVVSWMAMSLHLMRLVLIVWCIQGASCFIVSIHSILYCKSNALLSIIHIHLECVSFIFGCFSFNFERSKALVTALLRIVLDPGAPVHPLAFGGDTSQMLASFCASCLGSSCLFVPKLLLVLGIILLLFFAIFMNLFWRYRNLKSLFRFWMRVGFAFKWF